MLLAFRGVEKPPRDEGCPLRPAGWLDALLCRQLNARADAAASEICGQFRPGIEAALVQLAEARKWSTGVFQAQLAHSRRYWQVLLTLGSRLEPGRDEDD